MAEGLASKLLKVVLPKRKANERGTGITGTHVISSPDNVLAIPLYRDHLTDIFTSRASSDSRDLMESLFRHDPDVSAAVNAYLTVANTEPSMVVRDLEGNISPDGIKMLQDVILYLTRRFDYSLGFQLRPSLKSIAEDMRYMILLRGGIASELVLDKSLGPKEIRHVDMSSIRWYEKVPGEYKPKQDVGSGDEIDLDIPTFFVSFFRRNPTEIYSFSHFVSSINTIAARQQVINDLYRIMQKTGYPRMEATVLEEVLRKTAPSDVQADPVRLNAWMNARMSEFQGLLTNLRADQAIVHSDSVEMKILNEKNPGMGVNISDVIQTLNSQNQAALKTMATIIGRGENGVNTASVESRIFAMNADELNEPIAEVFSQMFTLALRLQGFDGYVECRFNEAELRPETELEPQLVMKASRLRQDLSYGLITDEEYHWMVYNRPAPAGVPTLSGTNFMNPATGAEVDVDKISPNSDPMGRSITPPGSKSARSNNVKK